jgi:predicted phosphodiesterase
MFSVLHLPHARAITGSLALILSLLAGYLTMIAASPMEITVGPVRVGSSLSPAWHGKSVVELPPAGSFEADTHSGPLVVRYALKEITVEQVEELTDPESPARQALDNWRDPVSSGVRSLLLRIGIMSAAAGGLISVLLMRRWRWLLIGAACGLASAATFGAVAYRTYDLAAFQEPRYSGNLSYAPDVLAFSQQTLANLDTYDVRVPEIAESLYTTVNQLHQLSPSLQPDETIRLLHISDMHSSSAAAKLVKNVTEIYSVDLVIDTGDETDLGTPFEASYPGTYLPLPKPYVWVAGNHDSPTITRVMRNIPGVTVLDREFVNISGISIGGFADPASLSISPQPSSDSVLAAEAEKIAESVSEQTPSPFIVAVHDPKQAARLAGRVPVVLNGHTHHELITTGSGTVFLDAGSTGAGGFRGFEAGREIPSTLQILYISTDPLKLTAVDTITIYGFSQEFSVVRRVFGPEEGAALPGLTLATVPYQGFGPR